MKINRLLNLSVSACLVAVTATISTSCDNKKSYADLLTDETKAVNYYLSGYRVVNKIPADNKFETGPDAPFYRMEEDGNIYMQVINPGDYENNKVEDNQLIYFRYSRYNLEYFQHTGEMVASGNSLDMWNSPTSFRFNNVTLQSSTQFGTGVQLPLHYLGIDCEVNIIIKSQFGFTSEIANVQPYLYNIRYFKSPL